MGARKTNWSFTIRTLLVFAAICAVALVYLWPFYDDEQFVRGFQNLENKTVDDVIGYCDIHGRELVISENSRGGLLGLHAYSKDGHMIALAIRPMHANNRPATGWQLGQLAEMQIQSINIYDLRAMRELEQNRFR